MKVEVSRHAERRMRERCGLNRKSIQRMAQKAYDKGITHNQTKGRLNKWITNIYFKNPKASNFRIYGDMLYIFADDILVTVFRLPNDLLKNIEYMIK